MQAPAMPPNEKSVAISDIATILGLLQHFSGVETGSKFSSGSCLVTRLCHLPLPPPVIISSGSHLCIRIDPNEKLHRWKTEEHLLNDLNKREGSNLELGKHPEHFYFR